MGERPTFTFREGKQCVLKDLERSRMESYHVHLQSMSMIGGLLTYRELTPKDWKNDGEYFKDQIRCNPMAGQWLTVTLTEKGTEASKKWNKNVSGSYTFTMASRRLVDVTGITDGDRGTKIAEFTWRWLQNPDVLDAFPLQNRGDRQGAATFKLYDDGWRLLGIESSPEAPVGAGLEGVVFSDIPLRSTVTANVTPPSRKTVVPPAVPIVEGGPTIISKAVIAADMQNGDPVGIRDRFPSSARSIVCYLELRGQRQGQVLKTVWVQPDGSERGRDRAVLGPPAPPGKIYFQFFALRPQRPLPAGSWRVDIYVDGTLVKYLTLTVC